MEDKNKISTYKIRITNEDVSFCEQVESNTLSPTSTVNVNGRKICKTSEVNSLELVRTLSKVSNTEGRISSDGLLSYDGIGNLQSKGSDLDSSGDEIK